MRDVKLNFAVPDPSAKQVAQGSLAMGTAVGEVLTHNVLAVVIAPVCLVAGLVQGIVLRPLARTYRAGLAAGQAKAAARAQKPAREEKPAPAMDARPSAPGTGTRNGAGDPDGDLPRDPIMSQA